MNVETIVGVYTVGVPAKLTPYLLNTGFMHEKLLSMFIVGSVLLSTNEILTIKFYYVSIPIVELKFIGIEPTPFIP